MNNILYIGPYKENNGLGRSSRRWLRCLESDNKNNICARPIYLTQNIVFDPTETFNFPSEKNTSTQYDYIIQHGSPDMFVYNKKFGKNIGIVDIETYNIGHSGWVEKINMMDEIIVGSSFSSTALYDAGVNIPIKIIPEPYENYNMSSTDFFFYQKEQERPFIFYTIGQYFEKKNINGIALAFLLEFRDDENVKLFIKTGDYYKENHDLENIIKFDIGNMHKAIKRYPVKDNKIDILCGILKDDDICRLHHSGDCYVNAVRSDGIGACAIEAKLADSIVINTDGIGSCDFINNLNSIIVDSIDIGVYSRDFYSSKTFTPHESWKEPTIYSIRKAMRRAFELSQQEKDDMDVLFDNNIFKYKYTMSQLL